MEETQFIKDKIVLIENDAIVFETSGARKMNEKVKAFIDKFNVGDEVEFKEYGDPSQVVFIKKAGQYTQKKKAELPKYSDIEKKEAGFVLIDGKWYATLGVLLNTMHTTFGSLWRLKTELVHFDTEKVEAIFKARVDILDDEGRVMGSYSGIGDANKNNVNTLMQKSFIRMAETRAVVRALRFATNIAEAALEELPSEEKKNGGVSKD